MEACVSASTQQAFPYSRSKTAKTGLTLCQQKMGGLTPDFKQQGDRDAARGITPDSTPSGKNQTPNQDFGKGEGDRGITRGDTAQPAAIGKNTTKNPGWESSDRGDRGTALQKNEGVGGLPNQQDTPPKTKGEELLSTPSAPSTFTQTQTQQGKQGAIGTDQSSPTATDRPDRLLRIDEWVFKLSQAANRNGTTYEAVKGLGVPDDLRPEIFAALTVSVKERLKGLRQEFEWRIPQDIEKWREAIATWPVLDANTLNAQRQQFDLWSQCLLGIGNWVEKINKSGLFDLAASVYSRAIELASDKSEPLVDSEVTKAELKPTQLNLLPDVQPPPASENRFAPESEDWF